MRAIRVTLVMVGLGLASALTIAGRAAYLELRSDFFAPREPVPELRSSNLPRALAVEFRAPQAVVRGWYIPPNNGAVIVLLHGTSSNRAQMLPEARIVASAGYGALLFDWPGSGESTERTTWGAGERAALVAALDFVGKQPGVAQGRLGVFAFSMGTLSAVQVAAEDERVAALVVAGAFGDPDSALAYQFKRFGRLSARPAVWAAHLAGMDVDGRRPQDVVARIAPRPLLIVAGSADNVVPAEDARALFWAAREPKELLIVDGAGHGEYTAKGGSGYAEALVRFFDRGLLRDTGP